MNPLLSSRSLRLSLVFVGAIGAITVSTSCSAQTVGVVNAATAAPNTANGVVATQ